MSVLSPLLLWLDQVQGRYWACAYLAIALVMLSAFAAYFAPSLRRWNRPELFAFLILAATFAFRWPILYDNQALNNPDESQMIAGAMVLKSAPVFWESVDGTTHGPLVQWPLAAFGRLGMRLDYTNSRIFAMLLAWSSVVFTWLTLRPRLGDGLARILVLPLALFVITTQYWDFAGYSSEHVPIALLSAATWLVMGAVLPARTGAAWRIGLGGVLLGAVPFAKLQGAPAGLWIGGAGLVFILTDRSLTRTPRLKLCAWLVGGAMLVPALIFAMVSIKGLWPDFWLSYFKANLAYARADPIDWTKALASFQYLANVAEQFREYFYPLGGMLLAGLVVRCFLAGRGDWPLLLFSVGLVLVAIYSILAPNRPFLHYLQFAVVPTALAAGLAIGSLIRRAEGKPWPRRARGLAILLVIAFVTVGSWWIFGFLRIISQPHAGQFVARQGRLVRTDVATFVHAISRPDDTVALWGWEPNIHVESARRHATREAHSALEMFASDFRDYYRLRYLADLRRQDPAVFVDVTGPGTFFFEDRARYGHETFPALAQYIQSRYRFLAAMGHARVYLRVDRPFDSPHQ